MKNNIKTQSEIDKFLADTKVYVDGKGREIQGKLFSFGYRWAFEGYDYGDDEDPFIFINKNKILESGCNMSSFKSNRRREITANDILLLRLSDKKVKRAERGWAGHFCLANRCLYHRNTLLECGGKKVVVSTVGQWFVPETGKFGQIGCGRYFETMAFMAQEHDRYNDADVTKGISFLSQWELPSPNMEIEADVMHEDVVEEITSMMMDDTLVEHIVDRDRNE